MSLLWITWIIEFLFLPLALSEELPSLLRITIDKLEKLKEQKNTDFLMNELSYQQELLTKKVSYLKGNKDWTLSTFYFKNKDIINPNVTFDYSAIDSSRWINTKTSGYFLGLQKNFSFQEREIEIQLGIKNTNYYSNSINYLVPNINQTDISGMLKFPILGSLNINYLEKFAYHQLNAKKKLHESVYFQAKTKEVLELLIQYLRIVEILDIENKEDLNLERAKNEILLEEYFSKNELEEISTKIKEKQMIILPKIILTSHDQSEPSAYLMDLEYESLKRDLYKKAQLPQIDFFFELQKMGLHTEKKQSFDQAIHGNNIQYALGIKVNYYFGNEEKKSLYHYHLIDWGIRKRQMEQNISLWRNEQLENFLDKKLHISKQKFIQKALDVLSSQNLKIKKKEEFYLQQLNQLNLVYLQGKLSLHGN